METIEKEMNRKEIIRQRIRQMRDALSSAWINQVSKKIQNRAKNLNEWKKANNVCCYLSMPGEVQTQLLIQEGWTAGKQICVPAFRKTSGHYELAWLRQGDKFVSGYGHVPEPIEPDWLETQGPLIQDTEIDTKPCIVDIVIIPGMAFDRSCARIGRGKGHYDRLLRMDIFNSAFKLGMAFEFQMMDVIPVEAHDVRMDAVVTEENFDRN